MRKALPYILPIIIGLALLPVPLLRDFHFESAMLAGTIGCFWAGIRSAKHSSKSDFFPSLKILGYLYLAGFPLFIFALLSSCLTIDGAGFWLFIPLPSVFFGTAIGRLVRTFWVPFPKTITALILFSCATIPLLYELLNFPQLYFFNHVWGYWPGPVYDETVSLTGSFFYFRWLTFLWIILLWMIPGWFNSLQNKIIIALTLVSLLFSYMYLDEAGIISPRETIQHQLGGYHQTHHFDLYYDDDFFTSQEVEYWAARHEFHFEQITGILEIDWPQDRRVESYLYAHAWQKKKLTGAKFTSFVPIWLEQDQLHIAKQHLERVLKHELVHVISKQFGNRLFNGSWSVGLIEGLAEGIAKDASQRSTLHQIVAAEKPYPTPDEIASVLSFWGFYKNAGAISYTTSGSFAAFLIHEYPVQSFKQLYHTGDFDASYPDSFEETVSGWHRLLDATELDSVDRQVSEFIFAQRSLFQKKCPHSISPKQKLWDDYQLHLTEKDTAKAHLALDKLYSLDPENELILDAWVRAQLLQGNYSEAVQSFPLSDTLLTLQVLKADALFLGRGFDEADSLLQFLSPDINSSTARNFRFSLQLREDSLQWQYHTQRRFSNILPDSAGFSSLNIPNQMLSLDKALQQNKSGLVSTYASLISAGSFDEHWFDIYEELIMKLAFVGEIEFAENIMARVGELDLRERYRERLFEVQEWVNFIKEYKLVAD